MGKGNIQAYWEKVSDDMQDVAFETVNVAPLGTDAIREIGTFRMTRKSNPMALEEEQGPPQPLERTAKYVFVWQKDPRRRTHPVKATGKCWGLKLPYRSIF